MKGDLTPSINWDGKTFKVNIPLPDLPKDLNRQKGLVLDMEVEPSLVYVVRIREAGTDRWSPGFVTPFTQQQIQDLKPNTEYELQVTAKNKHGESPPNSIRVKTNRHGSLGNVIPFPSNRTRT